MYVCADRAVVLGAQRDAWGKGYTRATVGTSVLMQLAKVIREMVDKGGKDSAGFGDYTAVLRPLKWFIIDLFLNRSPQAQEDFGVCKLECW